jgi:hypothetical protein
LINTLGLTELVGDALGSRKQKEAETNAKIVDLLKHALDETKNCRNEQQRVEFHIALACVMPARETQGTNTGWIARICERLVLKRGKRSQKNGGRPYASDQAVDIRAQFNKDVELLQQPLAEVRPLHLDVVARGGLLHACHRRPSACLSFHLLLVTKQFSEKELLHACHLLNRPTGEPVR